MAFRRTGSRHNYSSEPGSRVVVELDLLAATVDKHFFTADAPYRVLAINEVHSVVGGASAAARVRKTTGTAAPGASAGATVLELHTANFDLTATANTVQTGTLALALADLQLAAGDRLSVNVSGTLTNLVGTISVLLERE